MSGAVLPRRCCPSGSTTNERTAMTKYILGIDVACRAAHQGTLPTNAASSSGVPGSFARPRATSTSLWSSLPEDAELTVVMEPTRNAWVPLASWFQRRGAAVVMVPPEQSADLRDYYSKHTKSDRLDSRILARVPLLHPEGLHSLRGSVRLSTYGESPNCAPRW